MKGLDIRIWVNDEDADQLLVLMEQIFDWEPFVCGGTSAILPEGDDSWVDMVHASISGRGL